MIVDYAWSIQDNLFHDKIVKFKFELRLYLPSYWD